MKMNPEKFDTPESLKTWERTDMQHDPARWVEFKSPDGLAIVTYTGTWGYDIPELGAALEFRTLRQCMVHALKRLDGRGMVYTLQRQALRECIKAVLMAEETERGTR